MINPSVPPVSPQAVDSLANMLRGVRDYARSVLDLVTDPEMGAMHGLDDIIRLCVVALYADGHVLLEGNPGLGKTALVKALSEVLDLPFSRVQFTPDLLPSDIISLPALNLATSRFELNDGPIFTSFLLADEINRATPKTQSALLEAMGERQVTFNGKKRSLRVRKIPGTDTEITGPFVVMATQNPIDQEGTFDLPEAQLDRFMFKILMPAPKRTVIRQILKKETSEKGSIQPQNDVIKITKACSVYTDVATKVRSFSAQEVIFEHIENMMLASNHNLEGGSRGKVEDYALAMKLSESIEFGLGPRAAISLLTAAKAWGLLWGETHLQEVDARHVAKIVLPTLRHRVRLRAEYDPGTQQGSVAKSAYSESARDRDEIVDDFLTKFCIACAPKGRTEYASTFSRVLLDLRRASTE